MIILLLVLSIAVLITGVVIEAKSRYDGFGFEFGGTMATIIISAVLIVLLIVVSKGWVIDEKINLYATENNKIDNQICSIVESYKDYEKSTFESVKSKDANTLVTLFPELKSNTLVKEQIKIYNSNRKQIIQLKQEKIDLKLLRWWLYFGS